MTTSTEPAPIVNGVGAPWFEDLSPAFLDESADLGVSVVGCTANDTWDGTEESIENLQSVKRVVEGHPRAYVAQTRRDLEAGLLERTVGVVLGLQNPKPLGDSMNFIEAFADMGLRCCTLAFRENSYFGCGFSSAHDSGLSEVGRRAVRVLNRRGVVIDLSHVGDQTAKDTIEQSEHPVIFSHSVSRTLIERGPKVEWNGVKNSAVLRAAPDDLIVAAAAKGGVICPDARIAGSAPGLLEHIEYLVGLVGADHVGLTAQDDWHRSPKDAHRIQPYLPGYDSSAREADGGPGQDYRIYRLEDQLGPRVLHGGSLIAELNDRFSAEDVRKISGGNLIRVLRQVLPA